MLSDVMANTQSIIGIIGTIIIYADLGIGMAALISVFLKSVLLIVMFSFAGGALLMAQGAIMLMAIRKERIADNTTDSQTLEAQAAAGGTYVQYQDAKGKPVNPSQQKPARGKNAAPQYNENPPTSSPKAVIPNIAATIIRCAVCNSVMQKNPLKKGGYQLLCTNCGREVLIDTNNKHTILNAGDPSKKSLNKLLDRIGQGAQNTHIVDLDRTGSTPELADKQ